MTAFATVWAWQQPITPTSKLVFLALAEIAGGTGGTGGGEYSANLEIAVDSIVTSTGLERRTVQRHLRLLEASHHIVREDREDAYGKRLSNRWHLNVNELAPVTLPIWGDR